MNTLTITCQSCAKSYRIPVEKIPKKSKFALPCPNCKSHIVIDLAAKLAQTASEPSTPGASQPLFQRTPKERPQKTVESKKPLTGEELKRRILKTVDELPPMPQVVMKAQEIMADATAGIQELTRVIETDQGIASKMIKLANSAYYGLSGKVATVQKATMMLGQQTLKEVLLTVGYSKLMDQSLDGYDFAAGDLWRHSIAVGVSARIIADMKKTGDQSEVYLAGLIHDSGKLILNPYIIQLKPAFDKFMADESATFLNAEKRIFGFDHADIASDVCRKWHVPDAIAAAVRHHHAPSKSNGNSMSYIIHLADQIARTAGLGYGSDDYLYDVEAGTLEFLELDQTVIMEISAKVIETLLKFQD